MLRPLLSLLTLASTALPALSDAVAAPGTEDWCAHLGTTYEGVFFLPDGREALVFRAGIDGSTGCYAWLNAVPEWGLEPGSAMGEAQDRGDRAVIVFPSGVEIHLTSDGRAEHHRQGYITEGLIR